MITAELVTLCREACPDYRLDWETALAIPPGAYMLETVYRMTTGGTVYRHRYTYRTGKPTEREHSDEWTAADRHIITVEASIPTINLCMAEKSLVVRLIASEPNRPEKRTRFRIDANTGVIHCD